MKVYELFEEKETVDTLHPYGDVTSELYSYRLVMLVNDGNVTFEYQSGRVGSEDFIEYEECDKFDVDFNKLDWSEIERLANDLCEIQSSNTINAIKRARQSVENLMKG